MQTKFPLTVAEHYTNVIFLTLTIFLDNIRKCVREGGGVGRADQHVRIVPASRTRILGEVRIRINCINDGIPLRLGLE